MKSTETKRSPGKRKEARSGKNCARSGKAPLNLAVEEQVKHAQDRRWPDKLLEDKYFELNTAKKQRGRPADRKTKPDFFFPLMESLPTEQIKQVLLCASLEVQSVRRYPGWILSRTYNLKNRVLDFS